MILKTKVFVFCSRPEKLTIFYSGSSFPLTFT
jgi:hypothetical protein